MIEDLLAKIVSRGWRLVNLADTSVVGLPRWDCSLNRASEHPEYVYDVKYGQGPTAFAAISIALASNLRHVQRNGVPEPSGSGDFDLATLMALPKPAPLRLKIKVDL